jgi:hypothetical protein
MVDIARTYHYGIRVPNLEEAMAEYSSGLGVTWAAVQERDQQVWTPSTGVIKVPLRFTYSCEGPVHLELLEGAPGSVWDGRDHPGIHHTGVWVGNVAEETAALVAKGWKLVAAANAPEAGFGAFTYVQPPSGLIVELVWDAIEPMFQRWWAGGSLG